MQVTARRQRLARWLIKGPGQAVNQSFARSYRVPCATTAQATWEASREVSRSETSPDRAPRRMRSVRALAVLADGNKPIADGPLGQLEEPAARRR